MNHKRYQRKPTPPCDDPCPLLKIALAGNRSETNDARADSLYGIMETLLQKCLAAKAWPLPDLRYASNARAFSPVSKAM